MYRLKVCDGEVPPPALSGDICMNYRVGYTTYKVTFGEPITVNDNGSKSNIKLVVDPAGTAPNVVAELANIGSDNKTLYFVAQDMLGAIDNFVGSATLSFTAGANILSANSGLAVNPVLAQFTTAKTCPDTGWNGSYEGLLYVKSVTKTPEVLANGNHKLRITVEFANSGTGNSNAFITGTPALKLVKNDGFTTSSFSIPYVDGAGTTTLVFELVRTTPFDLVEYPNLVKSSGGIHTLVKDANGNDVYAPANLSQLNN